MDRKRLIASITAVFLGCMLPGPAYPAEVNAYAKAVVSTVRIGIIEKGTLGTVGTGVTVDSGSILTAEHVCKFLDGNDAPVFIQWIDGYHTSVRKYIHSGDGAFHDLCLIFPRLFKGAKDRMVPAHLSDKDADYGEHLYHIGMYLAPWHMAEGPNGSPIPSGYDGSHLIVTPIYGNIGKGSSGGGVWNVYGDLVGILVQARLRRLRVIGRGSFIALGVGLYTPISQVQEWLR